MLSVPENSLAQQTGRQDVLKDLESKFRQEIELRLSELSRIAANQLPDAAQGNPSQINLYSVGECVVMRSAHGGLPNGDADGGLVGVCLIQGDLNVPASETTFAVIIGAYRLSKQAGPLRGTKATVESIAIVDAEEP